MCSDKKILEFTLENAANTYTNYSSMEVVLPFNLLKKVTKQHKLMKTVTVNNFFGHWFTDIDWY